MHFFFFLVPFSLDEGGSDSMMNRPLFGMRNNSNTSLVHETLSRKLTIFFFLRAKNPSHFGWPCFSGFPFFFLAQICDAPLKEEEIPSRLAAIHWQKHRNSM